MPNTDIYTYIFFLSPTLFLTVIVFFACLFNVPFIFVVFLELVLTFYFNYVLTFFNFLKLFKVFLKKNSTLLTLGTPFSEFA